MHEGVPRSNSGGRFLIAISRIRLVKVYHGWCLLLPFLSGSFKGSVEPASIFSVLLPRSFASCYVGVCYTGCLFVFSYYPLFPLLVSIL